VNGSSFFWRCLLSATSVAEANVVYWCAVRGADEKPYRNDDRVLAQLLNVNRSALRDAVTSLAASGVLSKRVLPQSWSELSLDQKTLFAWLDNPVIRAEHAQLTTTSQLCGNRPITWMVDGPIWAEHAQLTTTSQLCGNRPLVDDVCRFAQVTGRSKAIVLAWLGSCSGNAGSVTASSRVMGQAFAGLIARRTAMDSLAGLVTDGLVTVSSQGAGRSASTTYRLLGDEFARRMADAQPPCGPEATTVVPGWANLDFRLLGQFASTSRVTTEAMEASHV
jgi:hypothetical protein